MTEGFLDFALFSIHNDHTSGIYGHSCSFEKTKEMKYIVQTRSFKQKTRSPTWTVEPTCFKNCPRRFNCDYLVPNLGFLSDMEASEEAV